MVTLPHQVSAAAGWELFDYGDDYLDGQADSGGACALTFGEVPADQIWELERVVLFCSGATATVVQLYDQPDGVARHRIDGVDVPAGSLAVNDLASPARLLNGRQLEIAWTGATAGDLCQARIQYRILRRLQ